MVSDLFRQGHLEMSGVPLEALQIQLHWNDFLLNRILCIFSIALWIVLLSEYMKLLPELRYCMLRGKGNVALEHSLSLSRTRSLLSAAMFLPFCLLCDRYKLFEPHWWDRIVEGGSILITCGICLVFIVIRKLISFFLCPKKLKGDEKGAVRNTLSNIFLFCIPLMLAISAVGKISGLGDTALKTTLICLIGLTYLLVLVREIEILRMHCDGFSTFLYLCALDFVPVGIVIFESLQ